MLRLLELGGGLERKRVGCHGPSVLAVGRQLALVLGVAVCLASAIKLAILLECSGLKNPVVHVVVFCPLACERRQCVRVVFTRVAQQLQGSLVKLRLTLQLLPVLVGADGVAELVALAPIARVKALLFLSLLVLVQLLVNVLVTVGDPVVLLLEVHVDCLAIFWHRARELLAEERVAVLGFGHVRFRFLLAAKRDVARLGEHAFAARQQRGFVELVVVHVGGRGWGRPCRRCCGCEAGRGAQEVLPPLLLLRS
mmetsp:Transcript_20552/g.61282  ORF Transcript_20552/g.61282 Transcript_20552/m.61282 type:complete len:253 (-) Transcript_20552:131-889(-)